jgi:hypothetical protein
MAKQAGWIHLPPLLKVPSQADSEEGHDVVVECVSACHGIVLDNEEALFLRQVGRRFASPCIKGEGVPSHLKDPEEVGLIWTEIYHHREWAVHVPKSLDLAPER